MIRRLGIALCLAGATATAASAQGDVAKKVSDAMYAAAGGKYAPPKCSADKNKHFKVSSAATYLKSAISDAKDPVARDNLVRQGRDVSLEAITQNGQEKAASAWYVYGRTSLFLGEVEAADTALARVLTLAPDCADDVNQLRSAAAQPLVTAGFDALKAQQPDAAIATLRQAQSLFGGAPTVYFGLAQAFGLQSNMDSAAVYYAKAANAAGSEARFQELKKLALYNGAVYNVRLNKHAEAVPMLEQFLQIVPDDAEAKRALAVAYRGSGNVERARAIDAELGTSTADNPTVNPALDSALALYNEKKLPEAIAALEKVLATEPTNITAIGALANAALAQKDGPRLAAAAQKLVALEPLNRDALRLLQEGHRMQKDSKGASAVGERILVLPFSVGVTGLTLSAGSAKVSGTATGLEPMDAKTGKVIAPQPVTLVFEMLDKSGAHVSTQEIAVPPLKAGEKHDFSFDAKGEGITGYRYKIKG